MNFLQPQNRIYHYCSLKVALEYILPSFNLRLSPITNTNDPRENESYWFSHKDFQFAERTWNMNDSQLTDIEYSKILRSDCKLICFSTDKDIYWGSLLSKMWAHYGDNHLGICLEIDKTKFIEENSSTYDFSLFREVNYFKFDPNNQPKNKSIEHKKRSELGTVNYLRNVFRKEHLDYLFFTKNEEWSSETEMRLIHFSDTPEYEYCSIKNSLANVHLGLNFHKSYLPAIKELLLNTDVNIVGTIYGPFGLLFKNIEE